MRNGSPRRDVSLTQEGAGVVERPLRWVQFQRCRGRTVGNVRNTGGIRTGSSSRKRGGVRCGQAGSPASLRVSLGPVKGRCVLEARLQVFPPQPSSLASIFLLLGNCALLALTASSAGPSSPCLGLVNSAERFILISSQSSPLAFDYSLISLIILSGFCSSCPLGQPILQLKCSPRFSYEFFSPPFFSLSFTFITSAIIPGGPKR